MKTIRPVHIWLIAVAVTLFFHSPLLAFTSVESLPYCLAEGTGLLEAESVKEIDTEIDVPPNTKHILTTSHTIFHELATDIPPGTYSHRSSILRI